MVVFETCLNVGAAALIDLQGFALSMAGVISTTLLGYKKFFIQTFIAPIYQLKQPILVLVT